MNGRNILSHQPELIVETDASRQGWGAVCREVQTGGPWLQSEKENHINYMELLVAM